MLNRLSIYSAPENPKRGGIRKTLLMPVLESNSRASYSPSQQNKRASRGSTNQFKLI